MTTTPATKPTRSRKAAPTADVVETPAAKPARKPRASKSSAQLAVVPEPVVETPVAKRARKNLEAPGVAPAVDTLVAEPKPEPKPSFAATVEATELLVLHDAVTAATEAFEAQLITLIEAGVSPSALSKTTGIATLTIRRIAKRRQPGLVK